MPDERLHPWDQLPQETDKAYAAFLLFRNLNPSTRTLAAAYEQQREVENGLKPSAKQAETKRKTGASSHFRIWAASHDWAARAKAFDHYLRQMSEQAILDEVMVAARRGYGLLSRFGVSGMTKATAGMSLLKPEEMTSRDVAALGNMSVNALAKALPDINQLLKSQIDNGKLDEAVQLALAEEMRHLASIIDDVLDELVADEEQRAAITHLIEKRWENRQNAQNNGPPESGPS
jgi:hypothetical protein